MQHCIHVHANLDAVSYVGTSPSRQSLISGDSSLHFCPNLEIILEISFPPAGDAAAALFATAVDLTQKAGNISMSIHKAAVAATAAATISLLAPMSSMFQHHSSMSSF